MIDIKKFTIGYDKVQDRISLTARGPNEEIILLWMTQRLLNRLAQALIGCLNKELETAVSMGGVADAAASGRQSVSGISPSSKNKVSGNIIPQLHAMEQSAAQAVHKPERPVRPMTPVEGFLLTTIELAQMPKGYLLVCRWSKDGAARLVMDSIQLRQCMGMLYRVVVSAEWSTKSWPAWFSQGFEMENMSENPILH